MDMKFVVYDDFLEQPDLVRNLALGQEYKTIEDSGVPYPGVSLEPNSQRFMRDLCCPYIAKLSGASSIVPRFSFFRLSTKDHRPQIYIHADGENEGWYAAILYLTPEPFCMGGTAFWQHKETGWTELPIDRADKLLYYTAEGTDESKWTLQNLVAMRWNRLLLMRGNQFHSRFPQYFPTDDRMAGRLTWVCFYNHLEEEGANDAAA